MEYNKYERTDAEKIERDALNGVGLWRVASGEVGAPDILAPKCSSEDFHGPNPSNLHPCCPWPHIYCGSALLAKIFCKHLNDRFLRHRSGLLDADDQQDKLLAASVGAARQRREQMVQLVTDAGPGGLSPADILTQLVPVMGTIGRATLNEWLAAEAASGTLFNPQRGQWVAAVHVKRDKISRRELQERVGIKAKRRATSNHLRRPIEQTRDIIDKLLVAEPRLTNKEIAEILGITLQRVGQVLKETAPQND